VVIESDKADMDVNPSTRAMSPLSSFQQVTAPLGAPIALQKRKPKKLRSNKPTLAALPNQTEDATTSPGQMADISATVEKPQLVQRWLSLKMVTREMDE